MNLVRKFEEEVSSWPRLSTQVHRFGGKEFCVGNAEVGHVHPNGILDIPFPVPLHDALLAEGLAEKHRWVPNSGWITFQLRHQEDLSHALWLMRLSYLRYTLKTAANPLELLARESLELRLDARFKALLNAFVPKPANPPAAELIKS